MSGRAAALAVALLAAASAPAAAQAPPEARAAAASAEDSEAAALAAAGRRAFDARDFSRAGGLWERAAAAGDPDARFGLGLIHDLGLGTPRDPAKARRWYLAAAASGHALAQFNVAVMLDSGADGFRDAEGAALWYGHAAAAGHPRARFNLGLLTAAGEGVARNPAAAAAWMRAAAPDIPAAAERVAPLAAAARTGARRLTAPAPLGALALPAEGGGLALSMVWSLPPAPPGARLVLEAATADGATLARAVLDPDGPTAATADLEGVAPGAPLLWRASLIEPASGRCLTAGWRRAAGDPAPPRGRVRLLHHASDPAAGRLAAELAAAFARAGFAAETALDDARPAETEVRFGCREDAALAGLVAGSLPALGPDAARRAPEAPLAPGLVTVRLSGGPAAADALP